MFPGHPTFFIVALFKQIWYFNEQKKYANVAELMSNRKPGLNVRWTMRNLNMLILTCGCLCIFPSSSHAAGYSPRVGQSHPDFTLPSIVDREPVSLSQFRGRKVLLIHFASW